MKIKLMLLLLCTAGAWVAVRAACDGIGQTGEAGANCLCDGTNCRRKMGGAVDYAKCAKGFYCTSWNFYTTNPQAICTPCTPQPLDSESLYSCYATTKKNSAWKDLGDLKGTDMATCSSLATTYAVKFNTTVDHWVIKDGDKEMCGSCTSANCGPCTVNQ